MPRIIDPPVHVTEQMISDYERDGVVRVENPFYSDWIDGLREMIDKTLADHEKGSSLSTVTAAPGRARVFNSVMTQPFARRWVIESTAAEIVARVIGSQTSRFYFDVAFCKMGGGEIGKDSRTGFHIDVSAFGFKGRQMPSFWMALDDVPEDNGPLVTALGSHKKVTNFYRSVYTQKPLIDGYKDLSEIYNFLDENKFEMKVWPVSKGDVLVLHPYMAHASMPMLRKDGQRYGFSTRWMGDDVRWRPNVYTEVESDAHPYALQDGDAPPAEWYPVMWGAKTGYAGREKGLFNAFNSMEPRPGYHNMEPGYKHTQLNDNY